MDPNQISDGEEYADLAFSGGDLREATITGVRFDRCTFEGIDASLAKLPGCVLADCRFDNCKLVGVDFTQLDRPRFGLHTALAFHGCQLDYAAFAGMQLRGSSFVDCRLKEASFAGSDLRESTFTASDLSGADFNGADLSDANLADATAYVIDPRLTRVEGLRVSHPEAEGFLTGLGLVVVPRGAE